MQSLRDQFPVRVVINGEDVSFEMDETFTFSNTDPGGFEACSIALPKDEPQLMRGDPIRIECGLKTAWEGRIKEIQRSLGAKTLIQGEGYAAILKENLIEEVFVDADLTKWLGPSIEEQIELIKAGFSSTSGVVEGVKVGNNIGAAPAIALTITGSWATGALPDVRSTYHSGNASIGEVVGIFTAGENLRPYNSSWGFEIVVGETSSGNKNQEGVISSGFSIVPAGEFTNAGLQFYNTLPGGVDNMLYIVYFSDLKVFGKHGLQKQGGNAGFFPSQIAEFVATKCPGIQVGLFEVASDYIVPHSSYIIAVPMEQAVSDMAKFAGWHWGVWESLTYLAGNQEPRLDFRPGPREGEPTAWCWRNECETLDIREISKTCTTRLRSRTPTSPG